MLFYPLLHNVVAPYVGAWIETRTDLATNGHDGSHPMWVRGLKHHPEPHVIEQEMSHPMWVRGLKHTVLLCPVCTNGRTLCGCVD